MTEKTLMKILSENDKLRKYIRKLQRELETTLQKGEKK